MPTPKQYADALSATPRNSWKYLADAMQPVSEFADEFKVKQDIPLIGGMSAADFTGLKGAFGLADDASYGKYPIRGASLQTAKVDPRVIDAMGLAGALMPVAKNVGKAALGEVARQIHTGTGIGRAALNPRMNMAAEGISKFPQPDGEIRSAIAQLNAAKPISEGGLGLPANNMPMDRAGAMGFDTKKNWYHGTDAEDFNSFNPMTYLSEHPSEASAYSHNSDLIIKEMALKKYKINPSREGDETFVPYSGTLDDFDSPEIGKLYATDNGVFKYINNGKWDAMSKLDVDYDNYKKSTGLTGEEIKIIKSNKGKAEDTVNEYISEVNDTFTRGTGSRVLPLLTSTKSPIELGAFEANVFGKRVGATDSKISDALLKYKNQGYDSIKTLSDVASFDPDAKLWFGGIPEQKIIFNPNQVRSRFAAFDPFRKHEADILAGVGIGGMLDPEAVSEEFRKKERK